MSESQPHANHVELPGSNRVHRAGAEVLGRSDRHEWCEVTIKVRRKAELPEPVAGKAALTREEVVQRHGADEADLDAVAATVQKYGLKVLSRDAAGRCVRVAGPVELMEQVFQVHLFRVKHGSRQYRGRVGPIFVPKELQGRVTGVFGLDTRRMARHCAHRPRPTQPAIPAADARPWYLPQELAAAYNFPNNDGAGQTIGIIELAGHYIESDLQTFAQLAGLPMVPTVNVVHAETVAPDSGNDPDAIGEVMLDIEVAAAVCPGSTLAVYFSNFTEQGWVDVIDAALNDTQNNPAVLSISYGLAEGTDIWTQQAIAGGERCHEGSCGAWYSGLYLFGR